MTKSSKTRKTFTRSNFAEHNYNYVNPSQTTQPRRRNTQNHLLSQKSNLPNTSQNPVNFQDHPYPPQDRSEKYPFFQQIRNKQQIPYYANNLSSDDDHYFQPDIFSPYTQEYCTQKPRQTQTSQNVKTYPQNSADIQSYQPLQMQNPNTIQSYQPTQMQNEIPLPYCLQQH